nr:Ycf36 [Porphyropsis coccinea]
MLNKKSCPVPLDQQPLEEYNALISSNFFSLPAQRIESYLLFLLCVSITSIILVVFLFLVTNSLPYSFSRLNFGLFFVADCPLAFCILRLYFSWAYVSRRLLSATIFYEESGWYDGQIWVKTADMLIYDRLIATNISLPMMKKIKLSIILFLLKLFIQIFITYCYI